MANHTAHIYFETERLLARQYTPKDVPALARIMADSRVHTFTKDRNSPWAEERTHRYIQFFIEKDFRSLDCYHAAVIEKATGQLIGLCGLNPYLTGEPEIEFKLSPASWGRGYATELGRQLLREAFAKTNVKGIYGMVWPENAASRRVLEKLGMRRMGEAAFHEHTAVVYRIAPPPCPRSAEAEP